MNRKDLRAGFEVRKIDKKDLVESAFAQKLGRKGFEVIRCGDEKDWGVVFCAGFPVTVPLFVIAPVLGG